MAHHTQRLRGVARDPTHPAPGQQRCVTSAGRWRVRGTVCEEFSAWGEQHNKALQKVGRGTIDQWMESPFLQFLAASPNRTSIHIIHRLEQSRVELYRMVGLGKRELGHRRVELQLGTL